LTRLADAWLRALAATSKHLSFRGKERLVHVLEDPLRMGWSLQTEVEVPGVGTLMIDTRSYIEWCLFFNGSYEPETRRLIERHLRPGGSAIDVGANVGVHTLAMARRARHGRVVACEPNPEVRSRLLANIDRNVCTNVVVDPRVVSESIGDRTLRLPPVGHGNFGVARLGAQGTDRRWSEVVVPSVTLDLLVEEMRLGRVDIVKIDVEGFEHQVLMGAHELLERDSPALLFEYAPSLWDSSGGDLGQLRERLGSLGYSIYEPRRGRLKPLGSVLPRAPMNLVALNAGAHERPPD
jgi:FkbM family methyltransferase